MENEEWELGIENGVRDGEEEETTILIRPHAEKIGIVSLIT